MTSLVWLVVPYSAFISFGWGHWWRWRHDRFRSGVIAGRTNISQAGRWLFRTGILLVLVPRIGEILLSRLNFGRTDGLSQLIVASAAIAAPIALFGAILLVLPDMVGGSTRAVTAVDRMTLPMLAAALLSGVLVTFDPQSTGSHSLVARTLFVWFPSLFTFSPRPGAMAHAPLIYQIRGMTVILAIGLWPYTRLAGLFLCPIERALRQVAASITSSTVRQAGLP